jgi:hypothetical protein
MGAKTIHLAMVGAFSALSSYAAAGNLILNPSFELSGGNRVITNWKKVYDGGAISENRAYDGKYSFTPAGPKGGVRSDITVPGPKCKLLIKANIYIESFQSGIIKPIHLSFISKGKKKYPHINLYPDQKGLKLNQWIEYKYILDLNKYPDVKTVLLWCIVYPDGAAPFVGKVYWDKVSVEIIDKKQK